MSVTASTEIYGLKAALAELQKIDSKTKFKAVNQIKASGAEMVSRVSMTYPAQPPLSGMAPSKKGTGRLSYDPKKVRKGVTIQVGGRSQRGSSPLVTLLQKDAAGAIFDMAGLRGDSGQFLHTSPMLTALPSVACGVSVNTSMAKPPKTFCRPSSKYSTR